MSESISAPGRAAMILGGLTGTLSERLRPESIRIRGALPADLQDLFDVDQVVMDYLPPGVVRVDLGEAGNLRRGEGALKAVPESDRVTWTLADIDAYAGRIAQQHRLPWTPLSRQT